MPKYAEGTEVSSDKSRAEIERTLKRFGASQFMYGTTDDKAVIAFKAYNRKVSFSLPLPSEKSFLKGKGSWGHEVDKTAQQAAVAYELSCRERWRALALSIKAKLAAVEAGIAVFEEEFFAHVVLPGGGTVYEKTADNVRIAYESGKTPPLLPHFD